MSFNPIKCLFEEGKKKALQANKLANSELGCKQDCKFTSIQKTQLINYNASLHFGLALSTRLAVGQRRKFAGQRSAKFNTTPTIQVGSNILDPPLAAIPLG